MVLLSCKDTLILRYRRLRSCATVCCFANFILQIRCYWRMLKLEQSCIGVHHFMVSDRTHGKAKKHSLLRSHLPQREQQIPRDVSIRESLQVWENASLDRLNSVFVDNERWLRVGAPFFGISDWKKVATKREC